VRFKSWDWRQTLEEIEARGLRRHKLTLESAQGVRVRVDGRTFLSFASNDYLSLANHFEIKAAAEDALKRFGVGSGASHMVLGHHAAHADLESALATFTHRERAITFSTGYMANLAMVASIADSKTLILQDKLNHASLIDAAALSGARSQRYLHNNLQSLEKYLVKATENPEYEKVLVLSDGVFSMDGDVAKLCSLSELCQRYNALLAVDDAHGFGVLGEHGGGVVEHFGLTSQQVPLLVGTFGKAFGTAGAFIAGNNEIIEYIEQKARAYIYTTAMPPAIAAATQKSLFLIGRAHSERAHLQNLGRFFREQATDLGFDVLPSVTAIQGVLIGESTAVMSLANYLNMQGILVGAIRPPTVAPGKARLRITLCADHSQVDVQRLIDALARAKQEGVMQ